MNRTLRFALTAGTCAFAATLACAAPLASGEHVGVNAERGDPARWYVPADTPRLLYATQVKEAGAALGEALKECRAMQAGRSDCVSQANAEHRRDMEDARRLLVNSRSPAPK